MRLVATALSSVAMAIAPLCAAEAQIERFDNSWRAARSDSTAVIAILEIELYRDTLVVRVIEEQCWRRRSQKDCTQDAEAVAYGPNEGADVWSSARTIVFTYRTTEWIRLVVASPSGNRELAVDVYSTPAAPGSRSSFAVRQLLHRVTYGAKPPPTPDDSAAIPQFPWPPPTPTAFERLPDGVVTSGAGDSLGRAFDRIKQALRRGDMSWWSAYAIGTDGFAIVTRMETIEPDGRPKPPPDRWSVPTDQLPTTFSGIGDYLKALFLARPGHYRVIVLAVTGRSISGAVGDLSADSAAKLLKGGEDALPEWLRRQVVRPGGRCVALIYEFARRSESDSVEMVPSSPVSVARHLALAGFWREEELRQ